MSRQKRAGEVASAGVEAAAGDVEDPAEIFGEGAALENTFSL